MRMQPLTYLIAGLLMALMGASFALMFAYRFDHFGWDLATPYRILIVTVPSVLGVLFVWRSGTLWTAGEAAVPSSPLPSASLPSAAAAARVIAAEHAAPVRDTPRRFLMAGLVFAIVAAASGGRQASAAAALQRDMQTIGFAIVSMLALVTAMLGFARVVRHLLWGVVLFDLLLVCVCAFDMTTR